MKKETKRELWLLVRWLRIEGLLLWIRIELAGLRSLRWIVIKIVKQKEDL